MNLSLVSQPLLKLETEALVLPLLADVPADRIRGLDKHLAQLLGKLNHYGDWKGEQNEVTILYPDQAEGVSKDAWFAGVKRIVLVGMGAQATWNYEKMRQAVATATSMLKARNLEEFTLLLPENVTPATAKDLATVMVLASYQFGFYKTVDRKDETPLETIQFFVTGLQEADSHSYQKALDHGLAIGQATNFARDLTNHPANIMTPRHLAADAEELADGKEITVKVLGEEAIEKLGMGAFLSVSQGSDEEPQLIIAEYHPAESTTKKLPTIGLAGKGITFDSGGISIKPSAGMDEMKMDMAGAATCLGVLAAARALKLPVHLVAVMPATENLPSGRATKPGDIVKSFDGKTIEILDTDAEGRMVLADAISYLAATYAPDAILDLATLTGAAIIALGYEAAPMLGNDAELLEQIRSAAQRTGERVWELPLWDEYKEMMKSEIADLKNIGEKRQAGTITGAAFLSYFVPEGIPWVHIDIAGVGMLEKPKAYMPKGGTGWGVRLVIDLLEHWHSNGK